MIIKKQPSGIVFSGLTPKLEIESVDQVIVVLSAGTNVLTDETYSPDTDGRIAVDFRMPINEALAYTIPDKDIFIQPEVSKTFTVSCTNVNSGVNQTFDFTALRGGLKSLSLTTNLWLSSNFLTWQPQQKLSTWAQPEWLSYYAISNCSVKITAHFIDKTSEELTLTTLQAGNIYTLNMQFSAIASKFPKQPVYFDVTVYKDNGERLTYIQRYVLEQQKNIDNIYCWENSLGGMDTAKFDGVHTDSPEYESQIASYDEYSVNYNPKKNEYSTQNTGYLSTYEVLWLPDFFISAHKYKLHKSGIKSIVTEEITTEKGNDKDIVGFEFKYRPAEYSQYLNLERNAGNLPEYLEIVAPDSEGLFILPPRLIEFPEILINENVLIPVQYPYSNGAWHRMSVGALKEFILKDLSITGPTEHNHEIDDINGLQEALEGKADESHAHESLETALNNKADKASALVLGETSVTAYRGDRGKIAYDHSQLVTGNPHKVTKTDVGLSNSENTSDADKPVSRATQAALNAKADKTELNNLVKRKESTNTTTFINTNLLTWERKDSSGIGTIKINLPNGWINTMLIFEIDFYNFNANGGSKLIISGYTYGAISAWHSCKTSILGAFPYTVRLAYDSQTDKCCILLGNTTTKWDYPGFSLSKVTSKFINADLWSTGYSCELISDESNISKVVTPAIDSVSLQQVTEGGNTTTKEIIAAAFKGVLGDVGGSMTIVPERNNEVNFGGSNASDVIYFGVRATGLRPKPGMFVFGYAGDASIKASGIIKTGSSDGHVLLGGGGHKLLSDFVKRQDTSNNTTFVNTNLLTWERMDGTGVGTIKINLPNGWINTMLTFEIDFYNFNANAGSKLYISGYAYGAMSAWYSYKTNIWGSFPYTVRLAYDSQTGKCCILLGNITTKWDYPSFSISKVISRFGNANSWSAGYSCELITDESKLTKIVTPAIDNDARIMTVSLTANNTTAVGHAYCDMADINIPDSGTKTIVYYPKAGIVTVLVINVAVNLAAPVVFKVGSTVLNTTNEIRYIGKYMVTLLSASDNDVSKTIIIVSKQ